MMHPDSVFHLRYTLYMWTSHLFHLSHLSLLCRYRRSMHSCQVSLLSANQTEEHPSEPDQDHPTG